MLFHLLTHLSRRQKTAIFCLLDAATAGLALLGTIILTQSTLTAVSLGTAILLGGALSGVFGLGQLQLKSYDLHGLADTGKFAAALGVMMLVIELASGNHLGLRTLALFPLLLAGGAALWRIGLFHWVNHLYRSSDQRLRIAIIGAGLTGQQLVAALRLDARKHPICFAETNPTLQGLTISGLAVMPLADLPDAVAQQGITQIIVADQQISNATLNDLMQKLDPLDCQLHRLAPIFDPLGPRLAPEPLYSLLDRPQLDQNLPQSHECYKDKVILITGAGGSIGSELCQQLLLCAPARLVLLDHSEAALYAVDQAMQAARSDIPIATELGNVCDQIQMQNLMRRHGVQVIFHAAAYKHVPLVEQNPLSGITNNVMGTHAITEAAHLCEVERFVLISSDKAVRPAGVMGASKRMAELIVQDLAARTWGIRFSIVRFGNVMGSSGSVIPLFQDQINRGGPVTVTDPQVERYFMTLSEAVHLVTLAGSFAKGGEVFALDMGQPLRILDLARRMIEQSGFSVQCPQQPQGDISIHFTGLRPGEKLKEELLIAPDMLPTPHPKILRAQERGAGSRDMSRALFMLKDALDARDGPRAQQILFETISPATPLSTAGNTRAGLH